MLAIIGVVRHWLTRRPLGTRRLRGPLFAGAVASAALCAWLPGVRVGAVGDVTLAPTTWAVGAVGGTALVSVTAASSSTAWTVSSDREWLSFTSASGTPSLTASTGTLATGGSLIAVATGPDGSIYMGQLGSAQGIYRVTAAGVVTTLATSTSGVEGIAVAPDGTVYYSLANHTIQRRLPDGTTTTFAGASGVTGSTDATGTAARFYWPSGLGLDATGNLYVADRDNHRIRKVNRAGIVGGRIV